MSNVEVKTPMFGKKRVKALIYSLAAVLIAAFAIWWIYYRSYVYTSDARIMTNVIQVAPQGIGGRVIKLYVDEGDSVVSGETLAELDHRILQAQFEKTQAKFEFAS